MENEEIMQELQRVSTLARRSRRAQIKNRIDEDDDANASDKGKKCGGHHGHRHNHAPDGNGAHSYGNHKCHGGSGRHGQNRILAALELKDEISQKDLAFLLGIRPQSLTQALETLEGDGFVTRKTSDADKRVSLVCLTDKGRGRAKKVAADRKQYSDDALAMLSADEKEQLGVILGKITAALEKPADK